VIQVKANDIDDASTLEYSIVDGNIGNAFKIEPKTGTIFVGNTLDYEKITSYELHIRAFDGASEDFCTVFIKVTNVNDNLPEFENDIHEITLEEETIPKDCIATVSTSVMSHGKDYKTCLDCGSKRTFQFMSVSFVSVGNLY
jgi:Cadherin domain.